MSAAASAQHRQDTHAAPTTTRMQARSRRSELALAQAPIWLGWRGGGAFGGNSEASTRTLPRWSALQRYEAERSSSTPSAGVVSRFERVLRAERHAHRALPLLFISLEAWISNMFLFAQPERKFLYNMYTKYIYIYCV